MFSAIKDMPRIMWQLALVYLFQWYALFCYWQNSSKSIGLSIYNATPENKEMYEKENKKQVLYGVELFHIKILVAWRWRR